MKFESQKHRRHSIRLKEYDYCVGGTKPAARQPGGYFVTIVTHQRACLFGEIVNEEMQLNAFGCLADECWRAGQVIGFFIGLLAGTVWMTCLYNSTGGSTLATALWHTVWNMVNIIGLVVSEETVAVMSTLVMVAAVLIVWKPAKLSPAQPHIIE